MILYATLLAEPSPRCVHCGGSLRPARLRASRAAGVLCLWCDERRHFRATRCQGRRLPRQPVRRFLPLPLDAGNAPSRTGVSKCFTHTMSHGTPVPVPVPTPLKTPPSPAGLYLGKKLGLTPPGYDDFKAIQYCSDIVDAFEGGVGKNNEDTHRGPLQAPRRTAPRHACEEDPWVGRRRPQEVPGRRAIQGAAVQPRARDPGPVLLWRRAVRRRLLLAAAHGLAGRVAVRAAEGGLCTQGLFTPLAVNRSLFTPLKDRGLDALAPYPKARAPDLTDRDLLAEM